MTLPEQARAMAGRLRDLVAREWSAVGTCDEAAALLVSLAEAMEWRDFLLSFECPRCGHVPAGDCVIAVGTSAASTEERVRLKLIELGWTPPLPAPPATEGEKG